MTASADKSSGAIALRVLRELEPSLVILASVLSIIAAGEAALAASYRANGYIYNSVIGDHFSEVRNCPPIRHDDVLINSV